MKKALELSPEQPYVLNYLGYSWIDQGLNLDAGMKMLKRATELRPDDGAITDSVGWAYYRLGQYDKAVEWLRAGERAEGRRRHRGRASRRRLLACRPLPRGALPVEAGAQPEARQGPHPGDARQGQQRAERRPTTSRRSTRRRPTGSRAAEPRDRLRCGRARQGQSLAERRRPPRRRLSPARFAGRLRRPRRRDRGRAVRPPVARASTGRSRPALAGEARQSRAEGRAPAGRSRRRGAARRAPAHQAHSRWRRVSAAARPMPRRRCRR